MVLCPCAGRGFAARCRYGAVVRGQRRDGPAPAGPARRSADAGRHGRGRAALRVRRTPRACRRQVPPGSPAGRAHRGPSGRRALDRPRARARRSQGRLRRGVAATPRGPVGAAGARRPRRSRRGQRRHVRPGRDRRRGIRRLQPPDRLRARGRHLVRARVLRPPDRLRDRAYRDHRGRRPPRAALRNPGPDRLPAARDRRPGDRPRAVRERRRLGPHAGRGAAAWHDGYQPHWGHTPTPRKVTSSADGSMLRNAMADPEGEVTTPMKCLIVDDHPVVGLLRKRLRCAIVVFTSNGGARLLAEALKAGVKGYVRKDSPPEDLVRAIRAAQEGNFYVDPALSSTIVLEEGDRTLTVRQREILQMLADGMQTEAVARKLGLSTETVRTHTKRILAKLHADTRTQAVAIAIRNGLIE